MLYLSAFIAVLFNICNSIVTNKHLLVADCPLGSAPVVNPHQKSGSIFNDIGGCGLQGHCANAHQRITNTVEDCRDRCRRDSRCISFNYQLINPKFCTLYAEKYPNHALPVPQKFCAINRNVLPSPFVRWVFSGGKQRIYLSNEASKNHGGCKAQRFQIKLYGAANNEHMGLYCGNKGGAFARNDYNINKLFIEKTIEIYTLLVDDIARPGIGAFSIDSDYPHDNSHAYNHRQFDSLVWSEWIPNQYAAGSEYTRRSFLPNGNRNNGGKLFGPFIRHIHNHVWPKAFDDALTHWVIVYSNVPKPNIKIFRDGVVYTHYTVSSLAVFANKYRFLFCQRHRFTPSWSGFIRSAAVYDYALTDDEVKMLYGNKRNLPVASEICVYAGGKLVPAAKQNNIHKKDGISMNFEDELVKYSYLGSIIDITLLAIVILCIICVGYYYNCVKNRSNIVKYSKVNNDLVTTSDGNSSAV